MNAATFELRFITPALVGGAYPKSEGEHKATAELRPSSIKGMLRWWHRFLGNDKPSEERIFGTAAGESGSSSSFTLRVIDPPSSVSVPQTAKQLGLHAGQVVDYVAFNLRNTEDARSVLPEGSKFYLSLLNRRLNNEDWKNLLTVVRHFAQLGSLGTRSRRGFGALALISENGKTTKLSLPNSLNKGRILLIEIPSIQGNTHARFLKHAGQWLKECRDSLGKRKHEVFGTAGSKSRLASPILMRPIQHEDFMTLLIVGPATLLGEIGLAGATPITLPCGSQTEPSADEVEHLLASQFTFNSIGQYQSTVATWQTQGRDKLIARFIELTQGPKYGGLRQQSWYQDLDPS